MFQLSILFLRDETTKDFKIRAHEALCLARWMAKLIYSLKTYLFQLQFKLTARELTTLRVFNVFVTQVYIKYWYIAACGELDLYNNLNLIKELNSYKKMNKVIADTAIKCFSIHLWYLGETLIRLAFLTAKRPD